MIVVDVVLIPSGANMESRRQSKVGPVLILVCFFAIFVFLLISRKGDARTSLPQSASQNR
jgi:preprotein translocase subunit YajC